MSNPYLQAAINKRDGLVQQKASVEAKAAPLLRQISDLDEQIARIAVVIDELPTLGITTSNTSPPPITATVQKDGSVKKTAAKEIVAAARELLSDGLRRKTWDIAIALETQGMYLGDTEEIRKQRISAVLSASDEFEPDRTLGWLFVSSKSAPSASSREEDDLA